MYFEDSSLIEVKVKKLNYTSESELVKVPFLEPDMVIQYLISAGLDIPEEQVVDFWERKRSVGEPWAIASPASNKHIPIAIYGDSARLQTSRKESKYFGIFISLPLWRPKSTRFSRWYIFSLENAKLLGTQILRPTLMRITYKLNMLFETGVTATDGRQLKFSCTEIRGNWEWHKQLFNLTSSWKSVKNLCYPCDCVSKSQDPKKLYFCLDKNPGWKEFSLWEFLATQLKEGPK